MISQSQKQWEKTENARFRLFSVFLVIFIMAGLFHVHHWNQYFFEVFELKTAQLLKIADRDQLLRLAEICRDRAKPDCEIASYQQILNANNKDYVAFEKLAETQFLARKYEAAEKTLQQYFLIGGDSVRAHYIRAKANEGLEKYDEAESFYEQTLSLKPHVLQVSVSEDYVNLLMSRSKYRKAKRYIDKMRRKGAPSYFLSTEYSKIKQNLNRSS